MIKLKVGDIIIYNYHTSEDVFTKGKEYKIVLIKGEDVFTTDDRHPNGDLIQPIEACDIFNFFILKKRKIIKQVNLP